MTALCVVLLAAAAVLWQPVRPSLAGGRGAEARRPVTSLTTPAAGALGLAVWWLDPHTLLLVLVVLGGGAGVATLSAQARARAQGDRRAERLVDACETLVGELRAGQPPSTALARTAACWPELGPIAAAARLGADVPGAMRGLGQLPGARGMQDLAAAWTVCARSGAGLAAASEQVLATTRARRSTDRLVHAELASARATARLVAVLPIGALAASQSLGGEPWWFLLRTAPGLACLVAGLALGILGLWWVERLATAVSAESW